MLSLGKALRLPRPKTEVPIHAAGFSRDPLLQQPRDVDGDPPSLVLSEHLCLPRFGLVVAGVDVGERLPAGIPHDIAAGHLVCAPRSPEAARRFCLPCVNRLTFSEVIKV
jgi:hypothetical protein